VRGLLAGGLLLGLGMAFNVMAAQSSTVRGPVAATVRVTPDSVRIGDPIALELEVVTDPSIELLMPSFGESLERFRILEFVPREHIDDQGRVVATQQYRLQVLSSGQHTIPALMVEFVDHRPGERASPRGEDAFELLTEPVDFEVLSVAPAESNAKLRPALGPLDKRIPGKNAHPLWWGLGISAAVLSGGGALWLFLWKRRNRRRSAYDIAVGRLEVLRTRPRPDSAAMDGFFVELSDIVRRYLEDRYSLHAPELTTEEFLIAAGNAELDDERLGFLHGFLRAADRVKFARHIPSSGQVESLVVAVDDFLERTREPTTRDKTSIRKYSVA